VWQWSAVRTQAKSDESRFSMNPKFKRVLEALFWFGMGILTYALLLELHRAR